MPQNTRGMRKSLGIADKILKYLDRNPGAMDTEKGIAEWWIGEDEQQVRSALALLAARKIVQIRVLNGEAYYLLNDRRPDRSSTGP